MRLPDVRAAAILALCATTLAGCNLEPWLNSCADCGQVRAITPRMLRNEIRLITDGPQARYISLKGLPPVPVVYDVRVRMDRGGSRDFVVSDPGKLAIGDRVEIQGGRILPHVTLSAQILWL